MKWFALGMIVTLQAWGAGGAGNGGGVHHCPLKNKTELFDLYEGRSRFQLPMNEDHLHFQEWEEADLFIANKLRENNPFLAKKALDVINQIDHGKMVLLENVDLKEIEDANLLMTEKNCTYEQLANWDDVTGKLFVDAQLYNKLNVRSKIALRWHEAIYKVYRDIHRVDNSDTTRKVVAQLFSDLPVERLSKEYEFEKTGILELGVKKIEPNVYALNVPYLTLNHKLQMTAVAFTEAEEKKIQEYQEMLKIGREGERRLTPSRRKKLNAKIANLEALKTKSFCIPVHTFHAEKICSGKLTDISVYDWVSMTMANPNASDLRRVYLKIIDGHNSIMIGFSPKSHDSTMSYSFLGGFYFTYGTVK